MANILNVNVHTRALRAAHRTPDTPGNVPEILHLPQVTKPKRFNLWGLLKGESVVNAHTTDGDSATFRVPHTLIGSLLVIALALISGGYWLVSTVTAIGKDVGYVREQNVVIGRVMETQTAYINAQTNRINFMVGLMTEENREKLYRFDKENPLPKPAQPTTSN